MAVPPPLLIMACRHLLRMLSAKIATSIVFCLQVTDDAWRRHNLQYKEHPSASLHCVVRRIDPSFPFPCSSQLQKEQESLK